MTSADPLRNIVNVVQVTDSELRKVMRDAAKDAEQILLSLGDDLRPGAALRRARTELASLNTELWLNANDSVRSGVGHGFDEASAWQARWDRALFEAINVAIPNWEASLTASTRQGLPNYLARRQNGYTLSQRVYINRALSRGAVDQIINNALILGKTPRQLAKEVRRYISPDVPGGVSYSAMRLGRTEVVNAYHRASANRYAETPWVDTVVWNLSGSHGKPDTCNEYADDVQIPNGNAGEWPASEVPDKPHPQCLCYTTPVSPSLDDFARRYKTGEFDDYLDAQMGLVTAA